MKLTIILLTAALTNVTARGLSQTISYSGNKVTLPVIFEVIKQQTGYVVLYNPEQVEQADPVTISVVREPLQTFLQQVLKDKPLNFSIENKTIFVSRKIDPAPAKAPPSPSSGPLLPMDVHGRVTNEEGQPVSEASVTIKSTGKGTLTDEKGRFSLRSLANGTELVVSHIGFSDQIVITGTDSFLNIRLAIAVKGLDAIVVKGYYKTSNRLNTGDVSTVSGEDIAKQPVTDPLLALEGRVPGLSIAQTSGVPGAYSTIRLRGQNSIYTADKPITANDPLFIVDGVPFSSQTLTGGDFGGGVLGTPGNPNDARQGMSPFNYLNPSDIESIDVLKDADATAIYGSRGANGVIIITTKKGKIGQTKVNLNVSTGASKITRKLDLLDTRQYLDMRYEAIKNDNLQRFIIPRNAGFLPDIMVWDTTRYTDWQKIFIGRAVNFTNAQANISGGNASTQFLIGSGYVRQGVIFPGNYADQKASMHFSLTNSSADDKLTTQLSALYTYDNSNLPTTDPTQSITLPPDAPALYDGNGNLNWQKFNGRTTFQNPLAYTVTNAKALSNFLSCNLQLNYQILPGFHLSSSFGYSLAQMNQIILIPSTSVAPPNDFPYNRSSVLAASDVKTWIIEPQANYTKQIGKGKLDFLIGSTFQSNNQSSNSLLAAGFASDALITNPKAAPTITLSSDNSSLYRYNAFYGKLNYNWNETYLLNLTARRDGSSRFGPGKQFGNFGAVGLGWIFSKEKWVQDMLPQISFGKIRASYGSTGNDQISDYQYLSTYYPNGLTYQGVTGLLPTRIPNPYFAWEKVEKLELGIELGIFKNRALVSANFYRNRTKNQLVGYPLPILTGFGTVQANLPALIQNSGFEFSLNTHIVQRSEFAWNVSLNFSVPQNKLLAYPGLATSVYANTFAIGHSLSSLFLYHYIGVDPQTGLYRFASKDNGIPQFFSDKIISKPISQIYYGGVQNTIIYKGFQIEIFLQFTKQWGHNFLSSLGDVGSAGNVPSFVLANHWQKVGDQSTIQRFSFGGSRPPGQAYQLLKNSDAVISDASFLRVKTVALSYHFPKKLGGKSGTLDSGLFLQCQNLFTLTNFKGMDPETGALNLPPLKTITAGFNISF